MRLIFSFSDGRRMEGMLVAVSPDQLRFLVPGLEDAMVIQRVAGYWTTEDGERIELECVIMNNEPDLTPPAA
jgi:hypothetical protein